VSNAWVVREHAALALGEINKANDLKSIIKQAVCNSLKKYKIYK
jgi:hypothetical protein